MKGINSLPLEAGEEYPTHILSLRDSLYGKHFPMPCDQERRADDHQPNTEANPNAQCAPAQTKTQKISQRDTDEPVSHKVREHGRLRVSRATESSRGHDLHAVE
jgi:hypothetical protein